MFQGSCCLGFHYPDPDHFIKTSNEHLGLDVPAFVGQVSIVSRCDISHVGGDFFQFLHKQ